MILAYEINKGNVIDIHECLWEKLQIDFASVKMKYEAFVKASGKRKCVKSRFSPLSIDDM